MSARFDADPQIGRTLGGQYRIEALLGYGGMGRVYRGLQLSVKRAVAIKLIAGRAPHPPEWVQRFRREAEATASLSHPNSVRLFDFGVTDSEELYMVMELLEGIDLAHQLQATGALPLTAALSIARQVLLALCEAHALGITHRDIKPDNIFLANVRGADVVAKVMDFGIAGLAQAQRGHRLTGTGVIIGTPLYMSPEQAQGHSVDGKSDVYSLGVVLFEMLTGRPVFEAKTAVNLLLAHVARPPMRLHESGVALREEATLQALLDRLLSKDPEQRPSAAEALESITALSARLGIASATGSMRAVSMPEATAHSAHHSPPQELASSMPEAAAHSARRSQRRHDLALSARDMAEEVGRSIRGTAAQGLAPSVSSLPDDAAHSARGTASRGLASSASNSPDDAAHSARRLQRPPGLTLSAQDMADEAAQSARRLQRPPGLALSAQDIADEAAHSARSLQRPPGLALSARDMVEHGFGRDPDRSGAASADRQSLPFQGVRPASAPTGAAVRPTVFVLGAGLVLTAATALALRWIPALVDAAQPAAATPVRSLQPVEPEERVVLVSSQPSGASVFVDGAKVGATPFELKLRRDVEISVLRDGYRRKLVHVAYEARSPVFVKLQPTDGRASRDEGAQQEERVGIATKATTAPAGDPPPSAAPPVAFSFRQENAPSVRARRETTADKVRLRTGPREANELAEKAEPREQTQRNAEPREQTQRNAGPREPSEPKPPPGSDAVDLADNATPQDVPEPQHNAELQEQALPEPPPRHATLDLEDDGNLYGPQRSRGAQLEAEHQPPSAAETTRSAARRPDPLQEDELSDVALDSEEQAHVKENYGLRAVGRAVARAFGRLLIPYPSRARRAELASMPLAYPSFREARSAYKHREIDATAFEEAVWQLRERRRQQIMREHDLYARGQTTQLQYEAHMDRIWDEFWGQRR